MDKKTLNLIFLGALIMFSAVACESFQEFKKVYMNADQAAIDDKTIQNLFIMAKNTLLKSDQKDNYLLASAKLDHDLGMPEAFAYYFVQFSPKPELEDLKDSQYLVVIRRFNNTVVYSDVFRLPTGDIFYKYNDVLKKISNNKD